MVPSSIPTKILLLEDSLDDAELLTMELRRQGLDIAVARVETADEFRDSLGAFAPDVILSDFSMPKFSGMHALQIARESAPQVPFIFVSGTIGEERAVEALHRGATDYVLKDNLARLVPSLKRALNERQERQKSAEQAEKIRRLSRINNMLSSVNAAIIRNHTRPALYREAVRIATEQGSLRLAWIAELDGATGTGDPVAWSGFGESYMAKVKVTSDPHAPVALRPANRALRSLTMEVCNDIATDPAMAEVCEAALAQGCRSVIALPFCVKGEPLAVMALYSEEVGFFDQEECALLKELALNISFALEHIAAAEALQSLAYFDPLTKCANRTLLMDRLNQAIAHARRMNCQVAVLFIDLDHFKHVNDSLGHTVGDQLLQCIARRLGECLRDADTLGRPGGDEFVVVLHDQIDEGLAKNVVDRVIKAIAAPVSLAGQELSISCSIGVSFYPNDGADGEMLLRNADAAMYRAKELGRNMFQFYTQELNARASKRLALEMDLRRAIDRNEFYVEYQPQISIDTDTVIGAEALVRWRHPEHGVIPPAEFIPLAEDTGLIEPIGEWVLRTACMQAKAWRDDGLPDMVISVNLSARQFQRRELKETIGQILRAADLDPQYLGLELTESLVMQNAEACAVTLATFKQMGIQISIDDFGTGYSSLNYLKRFPIDDIKIDRSFVRDLMTDPDDVVICKTIIALAHGLGLRVIAEGVETDQQLAWLRAYGCDRAQGYFFSRPLAPEAFSAYVRAYDLGAPAAR